MMGILLVLLEFINRPLMLMGNRSLLLLIHRNSISSHISTYITIQVSSLRKGIILPVIGNR
jgi:hypothetical protein